MADELALAAEDVLEQEEEEAYVESVEDGINMEADSEYQYSYWELFKHSVIKYFMNPWALLILAYVLFKIYGLVREKYFAPLYDRYEEWKGQRRMVEEYARMKKNPDEYRAKAVKMEEVRNRLQEKYEEEAAAWAVKQAEKEERLRAENIEDWESHQSGKGYKNRGGPREDKEREALETQARIKNKKGFRPEYNPLMGSGGGGSSGFRPARRTTGGG